jgi:hypothetical protein
VLKVEKINMKPDKKKKRKRKPDIWNADHPSRKKAIRIIEEVIEPLVKHGIQGEQYYDLEDKITLILNDK